MEDAADIDFEGLKKYTSLLHVFFKNEYIIQVGQTGFLKKLKYILHVLFDRPKKKQYNNNKRSIKTHVKYLISGVKFCWTTLSSTSVTCSTA